MKLENQPGWKLRQLRIGGLNGGIPGIVYGDESMQVVEVPEVVMQSLGAEIPEEWRCDRVQCLGDFLLESNSLFP